MSLPPGGNERALDPATLAASTGGTGAWSRLWGRFTGWFGPGVPVPVVAPPDTPPRSTDYLFGINLPVTPRSGEPLGFAQLRSLSNATAPRALIETVKDQMARHSWTIRPLDPKAKAPTKGDARVGMLTDFFSYPDREHDFVTWQRLLFEDMLGIDASTLYLRKTKGGKLYAAQVIDGASIRPVVDERGCRPEDGVAYRQVVHGLPAVDFTAAELIYAPRNPRPHTFYGFGPVEQSLLTINLAIRRELTQSEYFTDGSVPDALYQLPDGTTPGQAEEIAKRWASYYDHGNTAERRRLKFVPPGKFIETKQPPLKDEFDEYVWRVMCFFFSVPPTAFVKQMNRASAEQQQNTALEEGLLPRLLWFESVCRRVIQLGFGIDDLVLRFEDAKTPDEATQAELDNTYLRLGALTINEVRERKGLEPLPDGNEPLIYTSSGAVKLSDVIAGTELANTGTAAEGTIVDAAALGDDPAAVAHANGNGNGTRPALPAPERKALPAPATPAPKKLAKRAIASLTARERKTLAGAKRHSKPVLRQERALTSAVAATLDTVRARVTKAATARLAKRLRKDDPLDEQARAQRVGDSVEQVLAGITAEGFATLVDPTADALAAVAMVGAGQALASLKVTAADAVADLVIPNDAVVAFAQARSAELVGMRRLPDGTLVVNPNPEYAIDEGTRTLLRGTLTEAFTEEWTKAELTTALEDSYAFSEARAQLIARTEVSRALIAGNVATYQASGIPLLKTWALASEHPADDLCDDNAAAGPIPLDDAFPSGDDAPPGHPACECDILVAPADAAGAEEE